MTVLPANKGVHGVTPEMGEIRKDQVGLKVRGRVRNCRIILTMTNALPGCVFNSASITTVV